MRPCRVLVMLAALFLALGPARADAEIITVSFGFVASGFDAGAPVDPVTGSVSVTFDNSTDLMEQTTGIAVSGLNITLDSVPAFAYGAVADVLILGGLTSGAQTLAGGTNDFLFGVLNASTNPIPAGGFIYSQTPGFDVYRGDVELTAAPIPEPATLTLFGAGAALALLRRRRREAE